ncbi:unnamed protein product [Oikopleura dioica]|uniref:Uncharacterized protein n=1 Tax=Oikopleura dioica TaxID=34765 RepID=E4WYH0_OIKDI|nr:unnamed protein product [Oikopleura dioica]CBY35919.1 unnamed protein product [Oikopleura dioica]
MITLYTTSLSANLSMKKKCDEILMYLQGQKIEHTVIDLAGGPSNRKKMLEKIPDSVNPPILAPQIFADDEYRGGYDTFFDMRESELVYTWLRLTPREGSQESRLVNEYKSKGVPLPIN